MVVEIVLRNAAIIFFLFSKFTEINKWSSCFEGYNSKITYNLWFGAIDWNIVNGAFESWRVPLIKDTNVEASALNRYIYTYIRAGKKLCLECFKRSLTLKQETTYAHHL